MAKYVWYAVIDNNIVVLKDDEGRIHYCSACPCVHDKYKLFVDLIEYQPLLNAHPASNMPNRPGQYDTQITFNYFDRDYVVSDNLSALIYTFPQFNYFESNSKIFQQTVPLNVGREAHIDIFKQNSDLVYQRIVSGEVLGDYSNVWHWNKFGDNSSNYLCTYLEIPNTAQFYQYVSSLAFNNVNFDLSANYDLSLQREQFAVPSAAYVGYTWYYDVDDYDSFRPYLRMMWDKKQYYATRVISADNTAYCYTTDQPNDVYDMSNIAVLYQTIGGTLNKPQVGNYVYIGTINGYQIGLIKIGEKYYYYDNEYRLVKQYKNSVASCQVVASAFVNQYYSNSKYYTGLAFEYNNQTKYIYSKPSKLSIQSYNYGYLYPDIYQTYIDIRSGYYTQYNGYYHPLQFNSSSGWYFATYLSEYDPEDNSYVWLNDYTEESPPLYWQKDGNTYYTYNGPYYIEDQTYNQIVEVLTGNGFYTCKDGSFYEVKYNSTSGWYFITYNSSPENYTYILSGGTSTEPPPYNYTEDDVFYKVGQANWWRRKNDDNIHLLIDAYYDIRFGDLINIYSPAPYYGRENYDANRAFFNAKYNHKNMSPLVKYDTVRREWIADRIDVSTTTIASFLTSRNLDDIVTNSNFINGYSNIDNPAAVQFGLDEGYNNNISITTFRFSKPTAEEIQSKWNDYYNNSMSSVLDDLCGVYCQILTGVFIKPNSDSPKNIYNRNMQYQFRANGTFYQTLQFGKEYYFCPYFLQSGDVIDVLATQDGWDDFLTRLKGYSTVYNNFENNFYGNIIYDKFLNQTSGVVSFMACYYVRPISGVTSLDGSQQEHLAPAALIDQVPS